MKRRQARLYPCHRRSLTGARSNTEFARAADRAGDRASTRALRAQPRQSCCGADGFEASLSRSIQLKGHEIPNAMAKDRIRLDELDQSKSLTRR